MKLIISKVNNIYIHVLEMVYNKKLKKKFFFSIVIIPWKSPEVSVTVRVQGLQDKEWRVQSAWASGGSKVLQRVWEEHWYKLGVLHGKKRNLQTGGSDLPLLHQSEEQQHRLRAQGGVEKCGGEGNHKVDNFRNIRKILVDLF